MIWRQTADRATIEYHGETHIGRVRPVNSDAFLARAVSQIATSDDMAARLRDASAAEPHLFAVADGIGQEPGRTASRITIQTIRNVIGRRQHHFERLAAGEECDSPIDILKSAIQQAQENVRSEAARSDSPGDLGTTLTLACIAASRLFVAHVGDSRCYLFRDGELRQLTTDHTFAQRLVEAGVLEADRAMASQWRHVLWNVVGGGTSELLIEECEVELLPDDRVLLCSDGLSGVVPEIEIARVLRECDSPAACCSRMIDAANAAGGNDNITAVVAVVSR